MNVPRTSRHDVFLCYPSEQRDLAEFIRARLSGDGFKVFFDRKDIHYSGSFDRTIREAIEGSSVLVFVLARESVLPESYALYELHHALKTWAGTSRAPKRVVAVVAEPTVVVPPLLAATSILRRNDVHAHLTRVVRECRRHDPRFRRERFHGWAAFIGAMAAVSTVVMVAAAAVAISGRLLPRTWVALRGSVRPNISAPPRIEVEPPLPLPVAHEPEPTEVPPSPRHDSLPLGDGSSIDFVLIPAGRAMLGSRDQGEGTPVPEPRYEVEMPSFWMMRTEVTQGHWNALMGRRSEDALSCSHGCGDEFPVNQLTHEQVIAFTNALSTSIGRNPCYERRHGRWARREVCDGISLPLETQWEYAARAGSTATFSFGDDPGDLCDHANGRDYSRARAVHRDMASLDCDDGFIGLAPVARFEPNAWGLHDMLGNVWEWTDVDTPGDRHHRILRGGSFYDTSDGLRVAKRYRMHDTPYPSVGFRCVTNSPDRPSDLR